MIVLQSISGYLLPLFLAMSYFSIGLSNSRGGEGLKAGTPMKAAVIFSVTSFLLILAGYFSASIVENRLDGNGEWIALGMLMLVGFRMLFHGLRKKSSIKVFDIELTPVILAMALALGINMLFAGVAIRFMDFAPMRFGGMLAFLVWLLSFSGLLYGNQFTESFGRITEIVAGAGMLLVAVGFYLGF